MNRHKQNHISVQFTREHLRKLLPFIFLISLFISNFLIFNTGNSFTQFLNIEYNASLSETHPLFEQYQKSIEIDLPKHYSPSDHSIPIVILIPGDGVGDSVYNLIKSEYLRQGFIVSSLILDFSLQSILEINATINYFQNHDNFKHNPLGLFGHSHGAHYALYMGMMRSQDLSFVICANFGDIKLMQLDFQSPDVHYNSYISGTNTSFYNQEELFDFQEDLPPNLMIIANSWDPVFNSFEDSIESEVLDFWNTAQYNVVQGNFSEKTARYFLLDSTIFSHLNSLYSPTVINEEMQWIAQASGFQLAAFNISPIPSITLKFLFMLFCVICVIILVKPCIHSIYHQKIFHKKLVQEFKNYPFLQEHYIDTGEFGESLALALVEKPSIFPLPFKLFLNDSKSSFSLLYNYWMTGMLQFIFVLMFCFLILSGILSLIITPLQDLFFSSSNFLQISSFVKDFLLNFLQNVNGSIFSIGATFVWIFLLILIAESKITMALFYKTIKKMSWSKFKLYVLFSIEIFGFILLFSYFFIYQWIGRFTLFSIVSLTISFLGFQWISFKINMFFLNLRARDQQNGHSKEIVSKLVVVLVTLIIIQCLVFVREDKMYLSLMNFPILIIIPVFIALISSILNMREVSPITIGVINFVSYFGLLLFVNSFLSINT